MLLIFTAPPARAAGAACHAGAKATVDGIVNKVYWDKDKTWLYIVDPAWACSPIHIVVKDTDVCAAGAHVRASGILLEHDARDRSDGGWGLSDAQLASGKGVPYATSYTCVDDTGHLGLLKSGSGTVAKHKK